MTGPETKRRIVTSRDGSQTIFSEEFNQTYHSTEGAILESEYLFIQNGLLRLAKGTPLSGSIHILEYGFGTGLLPLLTVRAMEREPLLKGIRIDFTTLEKYPLTPQEYSILHYCQEEPDSKTLQKYLSELHKAPWGSVEENRFHDITPFFRINKIECDFEDFHPEEMTHSPIDLVYYDAFSPESQPHSWSVERFGSIAPSVREGGILVTYSSKGSVKEALRRTGFIVKRIKGAGRKRHSIVAMKGSTLPD